jgi:hypothetical protein
LIFSVTGFPERVRRGLERVQAAEEEEGPERAETAALCLLPLFAGEGLEAQFYDILFSLKYTSCIILFVSAWFRVKTPYFRRK